MGKNETVRFAHNYITGGFFKKHHAGGPPEASLAREGGPRDALFLIFRIKFPPYLRRTAPSVARCGIMEH
jgi:hypothetical protein